MFLRKWLSAFGSAHHKFQLISRPHSPFIFILVRVLHLSKRVAPILFAKLFVGAASMFVRIDSVWKWVWQGPSSIWQRRAGVELEDSWRFPSFSRLFVVLLLLFHTWSEENYRTIKLLSPPPFLPTTNIIKKFVCMSESRITTEFPHSLGLFDESIYFSPFKMSHFQVFFLIFLTFVFSRPKWIKVHIQHYCVVFYLQ